METRDVAQFYPLRSWIPSQPKKKKQKTDNKQA